MNLAAPNARVRGFTLIETLAVVVVIALLIGLTIPALASVRSRAGFTKSLANLHGISLSIQAYHDRYGWYPFFADAQQLAFTPPEQLPSFRAGISPEWEIERYWVCLMHDVSPWREHYETWISPGVQREKGRAWLAAGSAPDASGTSVDPSYRYSNSFIATAGTWSAGGEGEAKITARRNDMVAMPSAKVLMFDQDAAFVSGGLGAADARPVLFADGSGAGQKDVEASTPVRNRLRDRRPRAYHDTADGLGGRDR